MSKRRMYKCPRCHNKVRELYEWKGICYCGMCQQENIERYEATLIYRFLLFFKLTGSYIASIFGLILFPYWGSPRRLKRLLVTAVQGAKEYVRYHRAKIRQAKG